MEKNKMILKNGMYTVYRKRVYEINKWLDRELNNMWFNGSYGVISEWNLVKNHDEKILNKIRQNVEKCYDGEYMAPTSGSTYKNQVP